MKEYQVIYGSELETRVLHFGNTPVDISPGSMVRYTFHADNNKQANKIADGYIPEIKEILRDELKLPENVKLISLDVKVDKLENL